MALKMPGPVAFAPSHIRHLNVRTPADVLAKVRGTYVTLPRGGEQVAIKIGTKVLMSLRTTNEREARSRFSIAFAALQAHWETIRAGAKTVEDPVAASVADHDDSRQPLTHKQLVALAGEAYRQMVSDREDEPGDFAGAQLAHSKNQEVWRRGRRRNKKLARPLLHEDDARWLADMQLPFGPQLMTWRHGADLRTPYFSVGYRGALEDLFGATADALCASHELKLDRATRLRLLEQIGSAVIAGTARLKQFAAGDYSPDPHQSRFPRFEKESRVTVATLFARWREKRKDFVAASTIRRYTPSINSLATFLKDKDVRRISQDDIWDWAEHRRDNDQIAPSTVNGNDLVAAGSIFSFASTRDGTRLRLDNPVEGVRLEAPKKKRTREPFFRPAEVKAILELARSVDIGGRNSRQAASRRWIPWICAYSGARVQEPCWLRKEHVRQDPETGIWIMHFPQTKTGNERIVPLHDVLIEEGLLDYVQGVPEGLLFVDDSRPRKGETRSIQEQRASQIAEWIRDRVTLEDGVDPNHGWRHSFITRATGKMEKRIQNAICGHNEKKDVSDGYFTATVAEMKAGLDKFPKYKI